MDKEYPTDTAPVVIYEHPDMIVRWRVAAEKSGKTLNDYICDLLRDYTHHVSYLDIVNYKNRNG